MTRRVRFAIRVSSSSRFRIEPNSRAISDSVSSVLVYSRSCLEESGVLDGDGHVRPELTQDRLVGFRELTGRVAQEVERADDAALSAQRHDELGVRARDGLDVPRIGVDVVDQNRLPFGHRGAHQTLTDLQPQRAGELFRISDRIRDRQFLPARIEQIDREGVETSSAAR